jgi:hypothetical protein
MKGTLWKEQEQKLLGVLLRPASGLFLGLSRACCAGEGSGDGLRLHGKSPVCAWSWADNGSLPRFILTRILLLPYHHDLGTVTQVQALVLPSSRHASRAGRRTYNGTNTSSWLGTSTLLRAFRGMRKYHFDLIDNTTVTDQGRQECASDEQAIHVANQLALKLHSSKPELRSRGFKILVTDEDGEEIHVAPLDPPGRRLDW